MNKLLIGTLLTLVAANAVADNVFIYETESEQAQSTNDDSENNADKFTQKVRITYYNKDGKLESKLQNISYGTSSSVNSSSYVKSAYDSLR